jgi:hypothetical protein
MGLLSMLGIHANIGGSKSTSTNQHSQRVDPFTQGQYKDIWNAGNAAANAGPGPLLTGAAGYGSAAQAAGNLGFGAMSGDPRAVGQLMNPYQQQVIDANNAAWQKTNLQTGNQVNDAAARAGAFGGSRHGVTAGVALANNNMAQAQQTAGLLQGGYRDAMQQASALAGYGFQGAGLNTNLGFGGVGSPEMWRLQMMKQGFMAPMGMDESSVTRNTNIGGSFGIGRPQQY